MPTPFFIIDSNLGAATQKVTEVTVTLLALILFVMAISSRSVAAEHERAVGVYSNLVALETGEFGDRRHASVGNDHNCSSATLIFVINNFHALRHQDPQSILLSLNCLHCSTPPLRPPRSTT